MASIRAALDAGADGIEVDAMETADGQVVICHSDLLADHTFRPRLPYRVSDSTYDSLRCVRTGRNGDGNIPLLSDVLDEAGDRIVNIEMKDVKGAKRDRMRSFPNALAAVLRGRDTSNIIVSSFALIDLVDISKALPGVKTGLILDFPGNSERPIWPLSFGFEATYLQNTRENIEKAVAILPTLYSVHPEVFSINEDRIRKIIELDLAIYAWALNESSPSCLPLQDAGFKDAGIITDFVPAMLNIRKSFY